MTDVAHPHRNGGWRTAVIGGLSAMSLLFAGWMLNEAATERRAMEARINANESALAALRESVRNLQVQVYELRQEQRKR